MGRGQNALIGVRAYEIREREGRPAGRERMQDGIGPGLDRGGSLCATDAKIATSVTSKRSGRSK
jgi:Protein of unknown function (DUF2934)